MLALFGDGGVEVHGTSADTTELRVLVPVEQLMALACQSVVGFWQFIIALSQTTHLIATFACKWLVDAVGLGTIDVHHCCPWFRSGGGFFRYLIAIADLL